MDKTQLSKKAMVEALEKTLGIVTAACKQVGISRVTHYEWLREDEEYKKAVNDISEVAKDFVESQLFKQIKDNNPTSTIFFLKTKGKDRGYIERTEVVHDLGIESTIIEWTKAPDQEEE